MLQAMCVCNKCVDDYALQEFIRDNATSTYCSYCGRKTKKKKFAVDLYDLAEFMQEGIEAEYEDAANSVGWDSAEGGYLLPTDSTYELLADEIGLEVASDNLLDDLAGLLPDCSWCRKDPYGLPAHEQLQYGWEEFSNQVKHHTRYMFFPPSSEDGLWGDGVPPEQMLKVIGDVVNEIGLVRVLEPGFVVMRARVHRPGPQPTTVEELGPPPLDKAVHPNRMNPAGIPMFYGATDAMTAVLESYTATSDPTVATVASFQLTRAIHVIDLGRLPSIPSLFDSGRRDLRPGIQFLRAFVWDITKPVIRDGHQNIEYVPTQIVTEYFRHKFTDPSGRSMEGMLYPSSKAKAGVNCVLFFTADNCVGDSAACASDKAALFLDSSSIKQFELDIDVKIKELKQ